MKKFNVGDEVCYNGCSLVYLVKGYIQDVIIIGYDRGNKETIFQTSEDKLVLVEKVKNNNISNLPKKETKMNKQIIKLFPKTQDAVLVNQYFGRLFDANPLLAITLAGKEKEVISAALEMKATELEHCFK